MDKFLCSKLAFDHFSGKEHIVEFETFAGNKFEFKSYEVKVAVSETTSTGHRPSSLCE